MRVQSRAKRRASQTIPAAALASVRRNVAACEQELASVVSYLQRTDEQERRQLARALHDELGGALTSAKMDLHVLRTQLASDASAANRFDRVSRTIDEAVIVERHAVELLHPSLLEHLGLAAALEHLMRERCRSAGLTCELGSLQDADRVPAKQAIVIYRLVQEALALIVDGGSASRVDASLIRHQDGYVLKLGDDSRRLDGGSSFCERLTSMRQRAVSLQGRLDVLRHGRQGRCIEVRFP